MISEVIPAASGSAIKFHKVNTSPAEAATGSRLKINDVRLDSRLTNFGSKAER